MSCELIPRAFSTFKMAGVESKVKRPTHFSFYLEGFYLMLSGSMGKDV